MIGTVSRLPSPPTDAARPGDVRLRGFPDLAPLGLAQDWVDRHARLGAEEVPVEAAAGRILAAAPRAPADDPPFDRAGLDGYAVRASDTAGASPYDPVTLRLVEGGDRCSGACAGLVSAGAPLPPGADAVLGFDAAQPSGATLEVIAPAAPGAGVDRAAAQLRAGAPVGAAGARLGPREVALAAALGIARVPVVARPRVRLVVAGPREPAARDAHGPMLRALVARDGGEVASLEVGVPLATALARPPEGLTPDLVVVTGRTGTGPDDLAAAALAAAGEVVLHGLAVRPATSAGLGRAGAVPAVLLPGDPLACLVGWELLAGRLLRRLAGLDPALPHPTREAEVCRKLVSTVGFVEVFQVRLVDGQVEPLGLAELGGLAGAARADGFVVVPAPLEGHRPGARVTVHLY